MNHGLIAYFSVWLISLLISANKHGKPRTGKESFWAHLAGALISLAIVLWAAHWRLA